MLWDFHFFKTNPTAHATLNGSDEEKKFLKSSKGSPTYLRVVDDVFGFFFSTALFSGYVEKHIFSRKGNCFNTLAKKKELFGTELGYFSDQNS